MGTCWLVRYKSDIQNEGQDFKTCMHVKKHLITQINDSGSNKMNEKHISEA